MQDNVEKKLQNALDEIQDLILKIAANRSKGDILQSATIAESILQGAIYYYHKQTIKREKREKREERERKYEDMYRDARGMDFEG